VANGVRFSLPSAFALTIASLGAFACAVESTDYTTDAESGSTHALIEVERSAVLGETGSARAVAGFARLPAVMDSDSALRLVGLGLELPQVNQCAPRGRDLADEEQVAANGSFEFLPAGDITIEADTARTALAPRALATFGVLYTTRDQDAPLPTAADYSVRVSGSTLISPLEVAAEAPADVESVTVGGVPLTDVERVVAGQPVDITWGVGEAGDLVYVELSTPGGVTPVGCTFRDEHGNGTIPAGFFAGRGDGRLTLRRIRTHEFSGVAIARGELRFEFEIAHSVEFVE
jgi:hypothetical protein